MVYVQLRPVRHEFINGGWFRTDRERERERERRRARGRKGARNSIYRCGLALTIISAAEVTVICLSPATTTPSSGSSRNSRGDELFTSRSKMIWEPGRVIMRVQIINRDSLQTRRKHEEPQGGISGRFIS